MAQLIKVLTAKPDGLSLTLRTFMVEGEIQLLQLVLTLMYKLYIAQIFAHTPSKINKRM